MDLSEMIKRAVEIGDQFGFITFDQLDELARSSIDRLEAEDIEALFDALSDRGIHVTEA
jgi:sigma-70-like protein